MLAYIITSFWFCQQFFTTFFGSFALIQTFLYSRPGVFVDDVRNYTICCMLFLFCILWSICGDTLSLAWASISCPYPQDTDISNRRYIEFDVRQIYRHYACIKKSNHLFSGLLFCLYTLYTLFHFALAVQALLSWKPLSQDFVLTAPLSREPSNQRTFLIWAQMCRSYPQGFHLHENLLQ